MFIDPLHFVLAAGPLALYLLLLGGINLSTRPLVTTGGRDLMCLAIALAGCAVAGPLELFFPESFAGTPWLTWLMLLSLSGMIAVLTEVSAQDELEDQHIQAVRDVLSAALLAVEEPIYQSAVLPPSRSTERKRVE